MIAIRHGITLDIFNTVSRKKDQAGNGREALEPPMIQKRGSKVIGKSDNDSECLKIKPPWADNKKNSLWK
jgi:hypothetical protein